MHTAGLASFKPLRRKSNLSMERSSECGVRAGDKPEQHYNHHYRTITESQTSKRTYAAKE
jgi:hypothetical protein